MARLDGGFWRLPGGQDCEQLFDINDFLFFTLQEDGPWSRQFYSHSIVWRLAGHVIDYPVRRPTDQIRPLRHAHRHKPFGHRPPNPAEAKGGHSNLGRKGNSYLGLTRRGARLTALLASRKLARGRKSRGATPCAGRRVVLEKKAPTIAGGQRPRRDICLKSQRSRRPPTRIWSQGK